MRLALASGNLDVDKLGNTMSAAQLAEWEAFDQVEPIGRPWERAALGAAVACGPSDWDDFLRGFRPDGLPLTVEDE